MTGGNMAEKDVLIRLGETIAARKAADAGSSYVASLLAKGEDAILRKVLEEAAETLLASKEGDKLHVVRETADLWFHTLVLLAWHGAGPEDVLAELQRREGQSGIAEKASRK
jgi:phosphoribosyl-ATP pyrophosphohydrolase